MGKVRWGIVGPGRIANKFALAIKNVEEASLCAVASRSVEKSQEFAKTHNIEKVFSSYEEMARSDEIDAVYIATIHPAHYSCAELFIKNKKHVLCEKPLCVTSIDAKKLIALAKSEKVFLMEAMWTRFLPAVREAVKIVKSGTIGEVIGVDADFCFKVTNKSQSRVYKKDIAGGALLDVGIYTLNFVTMILGTEYEKISVSALTEDGVDTYTAIQVKYPESVASVKSSICLNKPNDAYVYGTKGYIRIPEFYKAEELFVYTDDVEHFLMKYAGNGFEEEIIEAVSLIKAGKTESDIMPLNETLFVIKLMDEVRKRIGLDF